MKPEDRLPLALFFLRLGVFVVFFIWTIDKLLRPEHAASIFERYYFLSGLGRQAAYLIGAVEMLLILGFVLGLAKRYTYGALLVLHAISTLATFAKYVAPFEAHNLLYFAAWPMLAACFALYVLRDSDTLWIISRRR
jgi:uncharacterized membrane protein YkgB